MRRTHNSIAINAVAAPANGQIVEYARSTSNAAPTSGWQTTLTFSGLSANTTYYIFARSRSNDNYNTGTASVLTVTTNKNPGASVSIPTGASKTDNCVTINPSSLLTATGQSIEYGINTSNSSATVATWEQQLTFCGLTANTHYYIFARSRENTSYNPGGPSTALEITTKQAGAAVSAPTFESKTHSSITIEAVEPPENGQAVEYGINASNNSATVTTWLPQLTFNELSPGTIYYIFARSQENADYGTGKPSLALEVITNKNPGATVSVPTLSSKTHNSITINASSLLAATGQSIEYGINTSNSSATVTTWEQQLTFNGLIANTAYYIFARSQENTSYNPSEPSSALEITTKQTGTIVSAPTFESKTHSSITIEAVEPPENGQAVEYGISTSNSSTFVATWQMPLTFDELSPGTIYYIFARSQENADYGIGEPSLALEATTKFNGSGTMSIDDWTYGEEAKVPKFDGIPNEYGSPAIEYSVKDKEDYSEDSPINAGDYTIRAVFAQTANYSEYVIAKNFTIAKANLVITPTASQSKIYGAADPVLAYTYSGNVSNEMPNFTGILSRESGDNAGGYAIQIGDLELANSGDFLASNYALALSSAPVYFAITPKQITITPTASQSKIYGTADPVLAYTYSGNVSNEMPNFTGALSRESGNNAGGYAIQIGDLELANSGNFLASNYALALSSVPVCFTITPKQITITPTASQSKIYGTADPVLAYTYSGNVNGEIPSFTGALSRESGSNAGGYAIQIGDLEFANSGNFLASNYALALSSVPVYFAITKAAGSGTVTITGWVQGQIANEPNVSSTNGTANVTYHYKIQGANDATYTETVPTEAGNYTVRATFAGTANYLECTATANFTITASETPIIPNRENPKIGAIGVQTYYTLKGTPLGTTKPTAPGVYLEKHGKHVRKIAVR